jgi:hypothetical protein
MTHSLQNDAASVAEPIDATPVSVIKVLVVDDELAGMDRSHLDQLDPSAAAFLGDPDSPEAEEILKIAELLIDVTALKEDHDKFAEFLTSQDFIRDVLISNVFNEKASGGLKKHFANFLAKCDQVGNLRREFVEAFPSPKNELIFRPSRPAPSELFAYDFVVLDLVLKGSSSPVDEMTDYLSALSGAAGKAQIPPLVVMSTHAELKAHRKVFSEKSSISAAGLWILPKADLIAPDFKSHGLQLVFDQLTRQRDTAQYMRQFVNCWTKAFDTARTNAAATLWNLDAAAMQRIHHTAIKDNDPYDGHLGELIAREYLWHVEADPAVSKAVNELDVCFRRELDSGDPLKIKYRFMAPLVDPKVTRGFFSRFSWVGWPFAEKFYGDEVSQPVQEFNTRVPFGVVLAKELIEGGECLIHITQQCDLNAATKPTPDDRSAIFATAVIHEARPHSLEAFGTQDLVARGLSSNGQEFDLKFAQGRTIAMPISSFLKLAEVEQYKIFGRLRFDIATHFVQATANQLTRPASFVMAREGSFKAKIFLKGEQFANGSVAYKGEDGKGRVVQVARDGSQFSFQDDDSLRLAIWLEREMKAHYAAAGVDIAGLANSFRLGRKVDDVIIPTVTLGIYYGSVEKAFLTVKTINIDTATVRLVMVADQSVKD